MIGVVLALLIVPLAAGLACFALAARLAAMVTVVSGLISFALVLEVVPAAAHHDLSYLSYLRVDAVSAIFLLATGFRRRTLRLLFPFPAMATWNRPLALISARRLRSMDPTRLAVGHGEVLTAGPLHTWRAEQSAHGS